MECWTICHLLLLLFILNKDMGIKMKNFKAYIFTCNLAGAMTLSTEPYFILLKSSSSIYIRKSLSVLKPAIRQFFKAWLISPIISRYNLLIECKTNHLKKFCSILTRHLCEKS